MEGRTERGLTERVRATPWRTARNAADRDGVGAALWKDAGITPAGDASAHVRVASVTPSDATTATLAKPESDLEYDPKLAIVAEWFDADALTKGHRDNAVTEVMLDEAAARKQLEFAWWRLPLVRLARP